MHVKGRTQELRQREVQSVEIGARGSSCSELDEGPVRRHASEQASRAVSGEVVTQLEEWAMDCILLPLRSTRKLIISYFQLVSKSAMPPSIISATTLPVEVDMLEVNRPSPARDKRSWGVRGAVMTLTVKRHLSRELQYRILDAYAARHKRSGGVILYALAAWFVGLILFLAYVPDKLSILGLLSR
jgi:hypothetical protein